MPPRLRSVRLLFLACVLVAFPVMAARELFRDDHEAAREIVDLLNIREGDRIAVYGPGGSHLLPHLAAEVGPSGRVYAVGDDAALVGAFEKSAAGNPVIVPILLRAREELPEKVSLVLLVNEYRNLDDRAEFFTAAKRRLLRGGEVAVIDYYRRKGEGPPLEQRVASHTVTRELKRFGLTLSERHRILKNQYFFVAELRR